MKVYRGDPNEWAPATASALSIGVFDGVHTGHRQVVDRLRAAAAEVRGLQLGLVTFDRHPLTVIRPREAPKMIVGLEHRLELLEQLGLDFAAVLSFDDRIRNLSPEEFCEQVLVDGLQTRLVAVGADFRFGRDRAGGADLLRKLGDHFGFKVEVIGLLEAPEGPVSSTTIRSLIRAGDVSAAARPLGRLYELRGTVVQGERRGAVIGFPTANLSIDPDLIVPGHGVYAAWAELGGKTVPAVVNVGVRPTFDAAAETVEAHLLDFDSDIYGSALKLKFVQRLRDEMKFDGVESLRAQISIDVAQARLLLA